VCVAKLDKTRRDNGALLSSAFTSAWLTYRIKTKTCWMDRFAQSHHCREASPLPFSIRRTPYAVRLAFASPEWTISTPMQSSFLPFLGRTTMLH